MPDLEIPYPDHEKAQRLYETLNQESLNIEQQAWAKELINMVDDLESQLEELTN